MLRPKLHIGEQPAEALLVMLRTDLAMLERRTARHCARVQLTSPDQVRLDAARLAVQQALETVRQLLPSTARKDP